LAPGATGCLGFELRPRNYVPVCVFPDPTKNGLLQIAEGMIPQFTVK
jgi:hypothetical protein